jgi:hypothetical protein
VRFSPAFEDSRSQFDASFLPGRHFVYNFGSGGSIFTSRVSFEQIGWAGGLPMMIFLFELLIDLHMHGKER